MAKGTLNKVMLIGNLGKDPEVRYTAQGLEVAKMPLATTETWKDKQSGERTDKTEWHNIIMFGKLGELAGSYLKKGSKVYIEGRIETQKWHDEKNNIDRYSTQIVCSAMQMLSNVEQYLPVKQPDPAPKQQIDEDIPF